MSKNTLSDEQKKQILANAQTILVRLAQKAYLLTDQHLRKTNSDLADFDPESEQWKGDSDKELTGLRPSYSRDWGGGGGFSFFADVERSQRAQFEALKRNDPMFDITKTIRSFLLNNETGMRLAGTPDIEVDTMLDFQSYMVRINQINYSAENALARIKSKLGIKSDSSEWRMDEDYRRYLEEQQNTAGLPQVTTVMHDIGTLDVKGLRQLAQPMSDKLYEKVIGIVLANLATAQGKQA